MVDPDVLPRRRVGLPPRHVAEPERAGHAVQVRVLVEDVRLAGDGEVVRVERVLVEDRLAREKRGRQDRQHFRHVGEVEGVEHAVVRPDPDEGLSIRVGGLEAGVARNAVVLLVLRRAPDDGRRRVHHRPEAGQPRRPLPVVPPDVVDDHGADRCGLAGDDGLDRRQVAQPGGHDRNQAAVRRVPGVDLSVVSARLLEYFRRVRPVKVGPGILDGRVRREARVLRLGDQVDTGACLLVGIGGVVIRIGASVLQLLRRVPFDRKVQLVEVAGPAREVGRREDEDLGSPSRRCPDRPTGDALARRVVALGSRRDDLREGLGDLLRLGRLESVVVGRVEVVGPDRGVARRARSLQRRGDR